MSRRTKFLTSGALMVAIGLSGGGLAYAASSGGAPTSLAHAPAVKVGGGTPGGPVLVPVGGRCPRLSLSPVHGVKAPKFTKAEARVRGHARPIACSAGKTSGR